VNEKLGGNFFDWRQEVTAFFAPSAQRNKQLLQPLECGSWDYNAARARCSEAAPS
jgi:hypothetical protein